MNQLEFKFPMTREEYLDLRNSNQMGELLYRFYQENAESVPKKLPKDLSRKDFFIAFNLWNPQGDTIGSVLNFYDRKFEITVMVDPKSNTITYY